MKNVLLLIFAFAFTVEASAVLPSYSLKVENMFKTAPNAVEFDINLKHTNSDSSTFEYAGGQYFFDFNIDISNGGTFTYSIIDSDLPVSLQPRNPSVFVVGGEMQLRLTINMIPSPGNGYIISSSALGTKIVTMKLQTTAQYFNTQFFQLRWRNSPTNPYTKIFANVGSALTDITTPATHTIDSLNFVLPVELKNFTAAVLGNTVFLQWTTIKELNNKGFDIQRSENEIDWKKIAYVNGAGQSDTLKNYSFTDQKLNAGIYNYRLKQSDYNGNFEYYFLRNEVNINSPDDFFLSQNYPNPFNPSTKIDFNIPYNSHVSIKLYDITGKEIQTLINEFKTAGYYSIRVDAGALNGGLSSGFYFYKMNATYDGKDYLITKKLLYIR